jgi:hypothetical protein
MIADANGTVEKQFVIVSEEEEEEVNGNELNDGKVNVAELCQRRSILLSAISSYKKCIRFLDEWMQEATV